MFVLSNAWSALMRRKGITALTALTALAVSFGTVAGLAVLKEYDTAHGTAYASQTATMAIRPDADAWKQMKATDNSSTKHYMTWTDYTTYAMAIQNATSSLEFTVTETVPARTTGDLKAVSGGSVDNENDNDTGGKLLWRAYYSADSAKTNDLGTYKIVEGKALDFNTSSSSSDTDTTSALISKAFAKENGLKVGDTFSPATAADASTTYKLTVRGIYEYTGDATTPSPVAQARNRDNTIYTTYATFAAAGLDPQDTDGSVTGWKVPDLDVVFKVGSPETYNEVLKTLKKQKLPKDGTVITSPSLDAYNTSLTGLDTLSAHTRTGLIVLLSVGGALLLALIVLGAYSRKRNDEMGFALITGVSRGRLGWQMMLEVFIVALPCLAIGIVAGAFSAKPLGTALAAGHATPITADSIWKTVWWGLGITLVLAVIAGLRAAFFSTKTLFAADGDWGTVETTVEEDSTNGKDGADSDATPQQTVTNNDDAEAQA